MSARTLPTHASDAPTTELASESGPDFLPHPGRKIQTLFKALFVATAGKARFDVGAGTHSLPQGCPKGLQTPINELLGLGPPGALGGFPEPPKGPPGVQTNELIA